jgi:HK97 family phage prohead protease
MAKKKTAPDFEERVIHSEIELRVDGDTKQKFIDGTIKVNSYSEDLGGFKEIILPGAFAPILKDDIRGLFNHNPDLILGRTKANTLSLNVNGDGHLLYTIELPETTYANDLAESVKRGDVTGTSFAFRVGKQNWIEEGNNPIIRQIVEFKEFRDISPVVYPAYPDNSVAVTLRALYEAEHPEPEPAEPDAFPVRENCKRKLRLIEIQK